MESAKIHILPDEIINKIAAGEVIERPASAVKELLENAIDAGATRIQVQIEQGGKQKIVVSDNGKGMGQADLDLCYLRHTTSKLSSADDLFHLHTNGFRGEAVASIAAVSKMTITSATDQGESNRIVLHGGNVIEREGVAASRGTTFLIEDLFYNTPVRRTFLGSEVAESSKILDVVLKIALAHPEIRIDYKVGEKSVFIGVPGELRTRIAEAIGSGIAKKMLPVDYTEAGVHVTGFISPTTEQNGKRYHQYLYLRNRPIENKAIAKAINQAYEPYGVNCKPVTVLFLDMPDMEFDVNVHPAKREVRFANQNLVFLVVTHAIRETFREDLEKNSPLIDLSSEIAGRVGTEVPTNDQSSIATPKFQEFNASALRFKDSGTSRYTPDKDEVQDLFSQPEAGKLISLEDSLQDPLWNKEPPEPENTPWAPPAVFQTANTYIVSEDSEGLLVIDQHAAHSRILYEQALEILKNGGSIDSQELLFPELTEFSRMEREIFDSVKDSLKTLGFYVEPFGGSEFQIRSIPCNLPISRAAKSVHEFLEDCIENGGKVDLAKVQESMAKAWAKTNAFQAGDKLKPEEMSRLVSQLMATEDPLKSPYGTPTLMRISLDELAKKFSR
ncbi:MAG: DNA mismatch repair endonuclease MutL [Fibrobacter sp.]|nr:DNA mismatch repair endonuclease MutL [Fibrobacter sp.]